MYIYAFSEGNDLWPGEVSLSARSPLINMYLYVQVSPISEACVFVCILIENYQ